MMQKFFFALLITFLIIFTSMASCGHKAPPKPPNAAPEDVKV